MEKVSTETLQTKAPNTSCCNCGKQVGQSFGSSWTKQADFIAYHAQNNMGYIKPNK